MKLGRNFYKRKTDVVAKDLLGCVLVHKKDGKRITGKIVETEAYRGYDDPGSHAYRGMTPRNSIMFGRPGFAYVYFVYGNHHCLNFVTEDDGTAGAVLIRAIEPVEGEDIMLKNRNGKNNLTDGPGKLTQAFGITKKHNGIDLTGNELYVMSGKNPNKITTTTRIGIKEGSNLKLRFYISNNKFVSIC